MSNYIAPSARTGAPVYTTDSKLHGIWGTRAANTLPLNAGDTLEIAKLPAGAMPVGVVLSVEAAADTTDADVGIKGGDTDGFIDGANLNTTLVHYANGALIGAPLAAESVVLLTINTADLDDTIDVYWAIFYIMP